MAAGVRSVSNPKESSEWMKSNHALTWPHSHAPAGKERPGRTGKSKAGASDGAEAAAASSLDQLDREPA